MGFSSINPLFWKTSSGWRNPLLKAKSHIKPDEICSLFNMKWSALYNLSHFQFSFTLKSHKTISWPLQALIAEVMSEAARKSVIAMLVETLSWWMLQSGAICDHWRAERIYWWQCIDFAPPGVRNHQCPSVCCHLQLTTWANCVQPMCLWKGGWKTEKRAQLEWFLQVLEVILEIKST